MCPEDLSLSWFHICRPPSLVSAAPKVHFSAELLPFLAWQCGGKHCPEIQNLLISFAYGSVTCFGLQGLSEAVWHMTIQQQQQPLPPPQDGGMDHPAGQQGQFPERLGEPDCVYYMRTGMCGFGQSCRFNHPPNRKLVRRDILITSPFFVLLEVQASIVLMGSQTSFAWFGISLLLLKVCWYSWNGVCLDCDVLWCVAGNEDDGNLIHSSAASFVRAHWLNAAELY